MVATTSYIQSIDFQEFKNNSPVLISKLKTELDTTGYALLKNYDIDFNNLEITKESYLNLCQQLGNPISHDTKNSIIWDIKSKPPSDKKGGVITYSEHNHEADLHTDSQYSSYPEDYFGLLTLSKAKCGGGLSYILTLTDIMEELNETEEGREVVRIFQTTEYPFIVPNVFKRGDGNKPEFVFGKILQNDEIRFRVDTIQKAINYDENFLTDEQLCAFNYFVDFVRNTKRTKKFFLENNDLVLINNKTTLHGRSSFQDYDRHLLRIRMNKFSKV